MEVGNKYSISAQYLKNYARKAQKHMDMGCEYHSNSPGKQRAFPRYTQSLIKKNDCIICVPFLFDLGVKAKKSCRLLCDAVCYKTRCFKASSQGDPGGWGEVW